jgi:hypothetical protein
MEEDKTKKTHSMEVLEPFFKEAEKIPNEEIFEYFKSIYSKVKFDNIFKHNITFRESQRFYGGNSIKAAWAVLKSTGRLFWCSETCPDDRYYSLGLLYSGRGNEEKANEYWSKIEEKSRLQILWQDCP